ncbi:hypothetical protein N7G274_003189 [Stereocaulon virgatum]|uniref:Uncharacterized protein n=1 Tax=Stereocaulon virgatum TaxID=373712 RepID=A0ABR4AG58_9LECA
MTPRRKPRPQAVLAPGVHKPNTIFYLTPLNDEAEFVVKDDRNKKFVANTKDDTAVLDIGFYIQPASQDILATIGRGNNVDIVLTGRDVART